jgi:hypothetical protein
VQPIFAAVGASRTDIFVKTGVTKNCPLFFKEPNAAHASPTIFHVFATFIWETQKMVADLEKIVAMLENIIWLPQISFGETQKRF